MGNNSAHAVVLPTQLCFSLRSSPPAQRLFTSVSFVSHPWSIQGGRHARLSCHFHEPSLTVFSLPTYFSWCRRLRAVGVVEELRLAPVALERVHDVPLGLRDLPQFRNEGACVPPYYRASPLHGGRVQGDLLKTRAKACTSEDLQLNAGGCLAWEGSPPDAGRRHSPPSNGAALEPKWLQKCSLPLSFLLAPRPRARRGNPVRSRSGLEGWVREPRPPAPSTFWGIGRTRALSLSVSLPSSTQTL